jgi:5-(carboxyamino)imidazole ribonucleotide synthase
MIRARIGIIGGGQLGKMMILEAKRLGLYTVTLDPSPDCPSGSVSDELIRGSVKDEAAIRSLAERVDVITYEWEQVGAEALIRLAQEGHTVYPSPAGLLVIQDKLLQKRALRAHGAAVPDFSPVGSAECLHAFAEKHGYPVMLKSRKDGYDGKGVAIIRGAEGVPSGFAAMGGGAVPLMAEAFVDYAMEISVVATRGINGTAVIYPIPVNAHLDNILDTSAVPAGLPGVVRRKAMDAAEKAMDAFGGVGTFCVEMFVGKDGDVLINEVAPRPHNSGHYTIEGCRVNQFENHIRAILGLPLGDTTFLHGACLMRNLLGQGDGPAVVTGLQEAYALPGVNVHIYGKGESKKGRKMGHYTITADTLDQAREIDAKIKEIVKIGV